MPLSKTIALVAHDNKKKDMLEWVMYNKGSLSKHKICATGTTGGLIEEALNIKVNCFKSGPYGGDQQIGAGIANGEIDILIFFWDPLTQLPHDPDVKALLRIAAVWNIPVACDRASADFIISSDLIHREYERDVPNLSGHMNRLKK